MLGLRRWFRGSAAPERPGAGTGRAGSGIAEALASAAALKEAGRFGQALAAIDAARAASEDPKLACARGDVLFAWGRLREALAAYAGAVREPSADHGAFLRMGDACLALGRASDAVTWFTKAAASGAAPGEVSKALAAAMQAQGRAGEAIRAYESALAADPSDTACLGNIGVCRIARGEFDAAERAFRRVIEVDARDPRGWINLGVALHRQGRTEEALRAIARARELGSEDPQVGEALANVGVYFERVGDPRSAIETYERLLPKAPNPNLHFAYSQALLAACRYADGWEQQEFRWLKSPASSPWRHSLVPHWAGQDAAGRTIVVRAEHGVGDTLQFVRYAAALEALGATVLLEAPPALAPLASGFAGIRGVVAQGAAALRCDFVVDVMSLPGRFGTEPTTIPANVPYVAAPPERVDAWRGRIDAHAPAGLRGAPKVGLVWAGNPGHVRDRERSMPADALNGLARAAGIRFYSLQKPGAGAAAPALPPALEIVDLGPGLRDFADTAAAIENLDLVVCVDTAVAHLAGALAKPVWILLQEPAEWRWAPERDSTPWYPTARLFRQRRPGDWREVVERVTDALIAWKAKGYAATSGPPAPRAWPVPPSRAALRPPAVAGLSRVTQGRVGILQFFPADDPVGPSLAWYGEWLQRELDVTLRWCVPGGAGLEAGAGIGAHAVALGAALGAAGHLILYEPRALCRRVLAQNLGANGVGNATIMSGNLGGPSSVAGGETIDDLALERLDWLKCADATLSAAVVAGAQATLSRLRPRILLAGSDPAGLASLARRVQASGYRCRRMATPLFDPRNFNLRDDDLFGGRSAHALVAIPDEAASAELPEGCEEVE